MACKQHQYASDQIVTVNKSWNYHTKTQHILLSTAPTNPDVTNGIYGARKCEQDTPLSVPPSTRRDHIRRYRRGEGRRTPPCSPQAQAHRPPQQQRRRRFRRQQECPPEHRSIAVHATKKKGVNTVLELESSVSQIFRLQRDGRGSSSSQSLGGRMLNKFM